MAHIQYVDELVREYMLFRGFSNSLKSFDVELKSDKDKSFRVDKILDQITHSINVHDLQSLRDIWNHLDSNLFNKLEHFFTTAVKKLEHGILKMYLVTAYTSNKPEKITDFFNKMASELHSQPEWKEWFFFPFCKNPEENSTFAVCFTKHWQDTLLLSLHNFLATIFQCMPQPTLTRAETEASLIKKLQEENLILRNRIQILNNQCSGTTGVGGGVTQASTSLTSTSLNNQHQSRLSTFNDQLAAGGQPRTPKLTNQKSQNVQTLNDIIPFDIPPNTPTHLVDDFYIIAQETLNAGSVAESQARGLKSLIRNIGSSGSPVLGRKESTDRSGSKRRSGSVTKGWIS